MTATAASFVHYYEPSADRRPDRPTLLLLHGTGGTEEDLVPLGRDLLPDANLLSPRGKVLEAGMPRFFRRLAEGVFDLADLQFRANELADWIAAAAENYGFDSGHVTAVGFSNGANIAAGILLLRPEALRGAVLFRAMTPFEPETRPNLSGKRILMAEGRHDPIVPVENAERLANLFEEAGADITLAWRDAGHGLTSADVEEAREWLRSND